MVFCKWLLKQRLANAKGYEIALPLLSNLTKLRQSSHKLETPYRNLHELMLIQLGLERKKKVIRKTHGHCIKWWFVISGRFFWCITLFTLDYRLLLAKMIFFIYIRSWLGKLTESWVHSDDLGQDPRPMSLVSGVFLLSGCLAEKTLLGYVSGSFECNLLS